MSPRLHVRQLELKRLVLPDLVPGDFSLCHVREALVDAALSQAHRQRRYCHPALVEDLEALGVTSAFFAEQVVEGDTAIREGQLLRVRR